MLTQWNEAYYKPTPYVKPKRTFTPPESNKKACLDLIEQGYSTMDEFVRKSCMSYETIAMALRALKKEGKVTSEPCGSRGGGTIYAWRKAC